MTTTERSGREDLSQAIAGLPWYHALDLPGGVTTPGYFDLRKVVDKILPADLTGKRCLDAATASGFFAFEMEKRGASEVVGIDLGSVQERDWQLPWLAPTAEIPMAQSFATAKSALGSSAEREVCSLYDASPERLGEFDFVFIGSVLLHLRDPVKALRALRSVTRGTLRSYEVHLFWASLLHPHKPIAHLAEQTDSRWWTPNAAAHRRWMVAAGFDVVDEGRMSFQPFGPGGKPRKNLRRFVQPSHWRMAFGENLFGTPSGWIEGRPIVTADEIPTQR